MKTCLSCPKQNNNTSLQALFNLLKYNYLARSYTGRNAGSLTFVYPIWARPDWYTIGYLLVDFLLLFLDYFLYLASGSRNSSPNFLILYNKNNSTSVYNLGRTPKLTLSEIL